MNYRENITSVVYKRFMFSAKDNFLTAAAELSADINYFIQVPNNINECLNKFYTLLVDLKKREEEIWNMIYHRTRSEINSFINNYEFEHAVLNNLNEQDLHHFFDLYDQFASEKKIRKTETSRLKAYNKHGILAVSYIKQNNRFICVNFYRVTEQRASNIHSFRPTETVHAGISNSIIGKAHRALHWLDIKEFKKSGVHYYDFCGWYEGTDNKELLNINSFKEQFTTHKVLEYNGVIYKNRLLKFVKNILGNG